MVLKISLKDFFFWRPNFFCFHLCIISCKILSAVCINILKFVYELLGYGWVGKLFKEWNLVLARKTYNALKHFTEKILYFITKSMQYVEYICFKNWKECARNYTLRNFPYWWWLHLVCCYCSRKSGCRSVNDVTLFPLQYHPGHFAVR